VISRKEILLNLVRSVRKAVNCIKYAIVLQILKIYILKTVFGEKISMK